MSDKIQLADETTAARCSITVADGAVTRINLSNHPAYWYDGRWWPYPKTDKIRIEHNLQRDFGYLPDERRGEKWAVYQDEALIVIRTDERPRIYKRGCGGVPYEIEPLL